MKKKQIMLNECTGSNLDIIVVPLEYYSGVEGINESNKKRGRKKKSKVYFPREVEDYIEKYNNESDAAIRNEIYNEHLKYPLEKLSENIINSFSFPYVDGGYKEIKSEVISHIIMNLDKYKKEKGKAFSYFSIVAKNYLIIRNNESYKEVKTVISVDGPSDSNSEDYDFDIIDEDQHKKTENYELEEFCKLLVEYWEENINRVFKKQRDRDIANSIIELFKNVKSLEFFNKKALYVLIRNMTDYKTQYITRVINKMSDHYDDIREMYLDKGTVYSGRKFF